MQLFLECVYHERMKDCLKFYINGSWVDPKEGNVLEVINPATEKPFARIALGSKADVDQAVKAARAAFPSYSATSKHERLELLHNIISVYKRRMDEMADAISMEMGAPFNLARKAQAPSGLGHITEIVEVLKNYLFEEVINNVLVTREPIGVCGFITPWNWPINIITCKVAPALAAGCTMILKPSEVAPISGILFTEFLDEAGVPAGVYNLVNGDGPTVGQAIAAHPDIDLVSFTGSTRGGIAVATAAAPTVKRVQQELGGKSPNIILDDADFAKAIQDGVQGCFNNSGQSCNAPTRMLVPAERQKEVVEIAKSVAEKLVVGDPTKETTNLGPVVNETQFKKIQDYIKTGIKEGATLVTGGPDRPAQLKEGYFVRPTVFANVRNDMTIAKEEIFGPVLSIIPYSSEEEAVSIANDTFYGLSSQVSSSDIDHARSIAKKIRAGMVHINAAPLDPAAPFGGYKHSGNGRERGRYGFEECLEVKSIFGYFQS